MPDRMSFEPVNTPFPLLKIDRVPWEIPMIDSIAIGVKIQAFLTDRCRGQHKWSERRIERISHASEPHGSAFLVLVFS